jgi:hypothetical protein
VTLAERLSWQEQVVANEATVTFDGPAVSRSVLWAGITAAACAAFFGYLVWYAPRRTPLPSFMWFKLAPLLLIAAAIALVWRGIPGASAGRIDVVGGRFRLVATRGFGSSIDVSLGDIDYFAGAGDDQAIDQAKPISPEWDRFRVFAYLRDGRRVAVATFREPEPALFMAQRLDALMERLRYRSSRV